MSLFEDQVCDVFPRRTVESQSAHTDHPPVLRSENGNDPLRLGTHRFLVGAGEVDSVCKSDGDRKGQIDLVPVAHGIDRHGLTDVLDHVFFRTSPSLSGRSRENRRRGDHKFAVETFHVSAPYDYRAQHDAEPADRQADHLTSFGARVPAPIAVPPRRSARHPDLTLALLALAAFLSVSTAAWMTMAALSDWDRAQEVAARV